MEGFLCSASELREKAFISNWCQTGSPAIKAEASQVSRRKVHVLKSCDKNHITSFASCNLLLFFSQYMLLKSQVQEACHMT